jgi:hypothetical protein
MLNVRVLCQCIAILLDEQRLEAFCLSANSPLCPISVGFWRWHSASAREVLYRDECSGLCLWPRWNLPCVLMYVANSLHFKFWRFKGLYQGMCLCVKVLHISVKSKRIFYLIQFSFDTYCYQKSVLITKELSCNVFLFTSLWRHVGVEV